MEESISIVRKQNLQVLFNIQGGRCCYCKGMTVLNPPSMDLEGKILPKYQATLEHLIPAQEATTENREDIKNQKMACRSCNQLMRDLPSCYRKNFFGKIKKGRFFYGKKFNENIKSSHKI